MVTQVRMFALTARAVRGQGTDHHDGLQGRLPGGSVSELSLEAGGM